MKSVCAWMYATGEYGFPPAIGNVLKAIREKAFSYFERGAETAAYLGSPYTWIDSYFPPLEVRKGVVPTDELVYGQELRVRVPGGFDGYFSVDLEQLPELKEKFLATKIFLEDCARSYGLQQNR